MKKKISTIIFLIIFSFIIIFLIWQSNSTKELFKKDYVVLRLINKEAFPFKKVFKKGTSVIDAINVLKLTTMNVKNIYIRKNRKWEQIDRDKKIFNDASFKIEY